jgi:probable O-glycosylation ligase (exosortase A-associated)
MRFSFFVALAMILGWFANESHLRRFWRADVRTNGMLLLAVLVSVSLGFAEDHRTYVLVYYVEFLKIILIALFTTGQVDDRRRLKTMLWAIALCLGFYGIKNGLLGLLRGGSTILRGPGGMLEDNNDFALALVMNIPLLFYLGRNETDRRIRNGTIVAVALTVVTILLTHSRGAAVALAGTVLLMAWRSGRLLQAAGLLALLIAAFLLFAPQHVLDRLATIGQGTQESSAGARVRAWTIALRMIEANPVIGVGIRNFQGHYARHSEGLYGDEGPGFAFVAHNSYLQIWAENGTIAFAIYLVLLGSVYVACRKVRQIARMRPDATYLLNYARMFETTTFGFMIGAMFLNRGHFDLAYHWLALVSAMLLVARQELAATPAPAPAGEARAGPVRLRPASVGAGMLPRWGR